MTKKLSGSLWMPGALAIAAVAVMCAGRVVAQAQMAEAPMAQGADPDWEVVTVKPSDPDDKNAGYRWEGRREHIERRTVKDMLIVGYGMQEKQLVGLPDWAETERWDVDGLPDVPGHPSLEQLQSLVRKILVERFGLKTHTEMKEMSVYAIQVAKGGLKLEKSKGDGIMHESDHDTAGQRVVNMRNATMGDFALVMNYALDRPVVDQSGVAGRYDFELKWTYDDAKAPTDGSAAPSLFTAVQEQVGVKFEAVKAPAKVMAIDRVERPSEN